MAVRRLIDTSARNKFNILLNEHDVMRDNSYQEMVEEVIKENRYLALSTTDGTEPWIATIEYIRDEAGSSSDRPPSSRPASGM
jgi:hypothetical protein